MPSEGECHDGAMASQHRIILAGACAIILLTAACGTPSTTTSGQTASVTPTITSSASPTPTASPTGTSSPTSTLTASPVAVDPSWKLLAETFFVWGVAATDVLNVRTAPGSSNPIITSLQPGARNIRVYNVHKWVLDSYIWAPIQIPGGAGWVNIGYLRPQGKNPPQVRGARTEALATAGEAVRRALSIGDYSALATLVDPTQGLMIEATTITADQVRGAPTDTTILSWGFNYGSPDSPVRATIKDEIRRLAGQTALTSPDVVGYDVRISGPGGDVSDVVAERFPGAHRVEYHYSGSTEYNQIDWDSIILAFDVSGSTPKLVGLFHEQWEP